MNILELGDCIIEGDRRALARGITLIESSRRDHRDLANSLIQHLQSLGRSAIRVGLSGTPGVGKSTFIENWGLLLIEQGKRVAVLAIDPSSAVSGGSILGDKTRMDRLSRSDQAFVRPSPNQTYLGGVGRRTRDAILLCEAAGFDVILTETVGVGQSEAVVADLTDIFMLLLNPAGGDELQGVKRGILEIADIVMVNKADGELKAAANRTHADYASALRLLRKRQQDPSGYPRVMIASAKEKIGLGAVWDAVESLYAWRQAEGHLDSRRVEQARYWFKQELQYALLSQLDTVDARDDFERLSKAVEQGQISTVVAVDEMLVGLKQRRPSE
ncbi:MAG: methylmalonyl Co-A mutase-associated GTPase MeaB [Aestuariivita sp.]|nr:methylmalonyl Co-A mutase-associated GTPase MeaB [Aestuariivita sp.]MCY4204053.1 methylmalonyl Co-A mutase-associated GTPase MeaB [Aestuariivita sp.]